MILRTSITRRYHFESAHWLPGVPETHKCHRMHGHNYEVELTIAGPTSEETGFIIDFWDLDAIVHPIISGIDHKVLNDYIPNPTAEFIAAWFLVAVAKALPTTHTVSQVRVFETKDCWATVVC